MAVIIENMDIPKCCNECIFLIQGPYPHFMKYCSVTNRILNRLVHYAGRRHCGCPLQEVKEQICQK